MSLLPTFLRPYDAQVSGRFDFLPPKECPVFEPTLEEFVNPIEYIKSITHIGEEYGICKIKPPPDWQPPFAIDVDKFKFVPRVQKLNELEAGTRIKLNFLDKIDKYWQLQGIQLKLPTVDKRLLDLYELYHLVEKYGGVEDLDLSRNWPKIAKALCFEAKSATQIRIHYMKILHPFNVFKKKNLAKLEQENEDDVVIIKTISEEEIKAAKRPVDVITLSDDEEPNLKKQKTDPEGEGKENAMVGTDYKPHGIESRQLIKAPNNKYRKTVSKHYDIKIEPVDDAPVKMEDGGVDYTANKELARLAFFGAGPKLPGYDPSRRSYESKTRGVKVDYKFDPLAKYTCKTCNKGDKEDYILLCDGCDDSYHTHCLVPPLLVVPEGDWRCPKCVALEVTKPGEAFGFEQAKRNYTLQQFGDVADTFKKNYFGMPCYAVPTSVVEREFWRIVSSMDEEVTVQYGADLHTVDHGSGFPMKGSANDENMLTEQEYCESPWNLNNLPIAEGSVLQFIAGEISGMKVPWMYVGMCFATFCWHNEDHWNYSINYLHWGEAKTWYGVPGSYADRLEAAMKAEVPDLFVNQPDLLHQLVTLMNPNVLMRRNVQVVRTDQKAGEFVVTFPRAYHAGFNQGYNFAEAVNFAPASWLKIGRDCIEHYRALRRTCVFSHDELVLRMAEKPENLTQEVARETLADIINMCRSERDFRRAVQEWGVTNANVYKFEELTDDERVCKFCRTTIYLSGVSCQCQRGAPGHSCLKHYTQLCLCPPQKHILHFRHALDELLAIVKRLKVRTERP